MRFYEFLSVSRLKLITNSDSTANSAIEKCIRDNIFNEIMPEIEISKKEITAKICGLITMTA